jgi:DNA-binding phage protein
MAKKLTRVVRKLTAAEKSRHAKIRAQVIKEFPPARQKKHQPTDNGIAAELRKVRKAQGLTYEAVARQAGIANSNTVKDVEYGRNTQLSDIEAIANALGLRLELVEA